jgi:hypothetical protein
LCSMGVSGADLAVSQCKASDSDYILRFNSQCRAPNVQAWVDAAKAATFAQKGACTTDPLTLKMSCEMSGTCEGGEQQTLVDTVLSRVVEYPCGSDCKGLLLVQCCEECAENQRQADSGQAPFDAMPTTVQCPGCGDDALNAIRKANTAMCNITNGKFRCSFNEFCKLGDPQVTSSTTERKCVITPCDVCKDADLKAQCCSICLEDAGCSGAADAMKRGLCRGCDAELALARAPAPLAIGKCYCGAR